MRKYFLVAASAGVFFLQSCKEQGPAIDFGPAGDDTTYTADVETAQAKKVLAEEFTGVSCPPCPKGHNIMRSIKSNLQGKVVILGYHIYNYPQSTPIDDGTHKSAHDFRTQDATDAANTIFGGLPGLPYASFDRVAINGSLLNNITLWSGAASDRSKETSPVNIHITPSYNAATREATVVVKLAYTDNVLVKQNLTVAVTEDSVVDLQKTDDVTINIFEEYDHEHILRDIITPVIGAQIPDKVNPKVPGRVYERTFKFMVSNDWKPQHCNIVAFVTDDDANSRRAVQAEEVKLVQ